jgi:integrase
MAMQRFVADWLADWRRLIMATKLPATAARKRPAGRLHLLSVREVQTAKRGDHNDGGKLILRVRDDSASWVFRFTPPGGGSRREMGLGIAWRGSAEQAGATLKSARRNAHEARELIARGLDPIDERECRREVDRRAQQAKQVQQELRQWTLARCARDYHARVIEPTRTPKHAAQWMASLENHIPASLWDKSIRDIEPPELLEALRGARPHQRARNLDSSAIIGETVRRVRQRLDAVFEDAVFHKRCANNPAAAVRRKLREADVRGKTVGLRALPYLDAADFMAKLRERPGTAARCLEFALLTAARTNEALGAVWSEFDLNAQTWLVPAHRMKASGKQKPEPHFVHLSSPALALLEDQLALGLDEDWVFPSPMLRGRPMSNMAMLTLLGRMDVRRATTVHGLCRATFSTWAYETAAARPDVIEACLAHREADKVKAAYNRAEFMEERRSLLTAWAAYLCSKPSAAQPRQQFRAFNSFEEYQ